jgi:hypothetical protein
MLANIFHRRMSFRFDVRRNFFTQANANNPRRMDFALFLWSVPRGIPRQPSVLPEISTYPKNRQK